MSDQVQSEEEALAESIATASLNASGEIFAPGNDSEHEFGVMYQGPWETLADGTGRAVRRHARALSKTGIPVLLKSFSHTRRVNGFLQPCYGDHDPYVLAEIGNIHQTSIRSLALSIKHSVVTTPDQLRCLLYPRGVLGADPHQTALWQAMVAASTVLYTVWERDHIPEQIAKLMSKAGQCWVPCYSNLAALIKSGVPENKVKVVPHPYTSDEKVMADSRATHPNAPALYAIGAWQPRKAFHELIGAYLMAFSPKEITTLRIHTTETIWPNYPSPRESIMHWLSQPEVKANGWRADNLKGKLEVSFKNFTPTQLHEFHCNNNIYVCCSHGEAWCLPAFDAKLYGNRMVYVQWGGPIDFAACDDMPVACSMEPVDPQYGWGDCTWAGIDVGYLGTKIQEAIGYFEWSKNRDKQPLSDKFSEMRVGHHMRNLLFELSQSVHQPKLHKALWGVK